MLKVEAVYKDQGKGSEPKFSHFKAIVGTVHYEPIPIKFLRISELQHLEQMLSIAWEMGRTGLSQKD